MFERKKFYNQLLEMNGNIRVFCRVRPLLATGPPPVLSRFGGYSEIRELPKMARLRYAENGEIELKRADGRRHPFEFDAVYKHTDGQERVFEDIA
eukprot:SAG31_NODE_30658_length_378_cov_0.544803_1_plen_94_part_01